MQFDCFRVGSRSKQTAPFAVEQINDLVAWLIDPQSSGEYRAVELLLRKHIIEIRRRLDRLESARHIGAMTNRVMADYPHRG